MLLKRARVVCECGRRRRCSSGEFVKRSACGRWGRSFCRAGVKVPGVGLIVALGLGTAPALGARVREWYRVDIGQAAEYGKHQDRAGAVWPTAPRGSGMRLGVDDALDDAKQVEGVGASGQSASPSRRRRGEGGEAIEKLWWYPSAG